MVLLVVLVRRGRRGDCAAMGVEVRVFEEVVPQVARAFFAVEGASGLGDGHDSMG